MTTRKYSSRSQQTTLTSAVTSGATVIPVANATTLLGGATVSTGQTFTVVIDPDTALEEIVDITVVSGNNLTVTRDVDMAGASAQDHSAGAVIRHMIIGRDLRESNLHIEASAAYNDGTGTHALHGLSGSDGSVVGTDAAQTLTNKILVAPVLTSTLENDAGITFEGTTADAYETLLTVVDPTQDNTITLPNTSGTLDIIDATQTLTNKTLTTATLGSNLAAGGYKITGLGTPTASTDAVTKTYADANVAAAATSAASAATSATAAATSASSAATSATSAAASVSSISAYATAAATSATSAAASATAAATSATSAAASASSMTASVTAAASSATAAATSATSAAASATAAATSATSAAASATAAATSATSAAASVSAVATSASSALTSQTAAATSATSAAASATAAATSATSAAASATAAATSASSAATTYTAYDARYLGSKATAPTVDNLGNALITGATYWNSVANVMYVWSGSAWSAVSTANGAVTTGTLAQFAATTSVQLAGVISDETGTGALVFANTPTLVTPVLGTPTSVTLTNGTGLPVSGITASTSTALGVGSIELGHATDTTLSRSAAGVLAVEGVVIPSISSTNTLTNKSLSDSTIFFVDVTDATKKLNIDVTGTTGITGTLTSTFTTAKTLTLPDATDTLVGKATTDTLTNKTLSAAVLTGTLTANGSAGTNGYYLQTTGSGVQWAAAASDPTADIFMMMGA